MTGNHKSVKSLKEPPLYFPSASGKAKRSHWMGCLSEMEWLFSWVLKSYSLLVLRSCTTGGLCRPGVGIKESTHFNLFHETVQSYHDLYMFSPGLIKHLCSEASGYPVERRCSPGLFAYVYYLGERHCSSGLFTYCRCGCITSWGSVNVESTCPLEGISHKVTTLRDYSASECCLWNSPFKKLTRHISVSALASCIVLPFFALVLLQSLIWNEMQLEANYILWPDLLEQSSALDWEMESIWDNVWEDIEYVECHCFVY